MYTTRCSIPPYRKSKKYVKKALEYAETSIAIAPNWRNEWIKAQRFSADYWLYIVTDCTSEPMATPVTIHGRAIRETGASRSPSRRGGRE